MNKTAVLGGQMNQIVFSPYWNVLKYFKKRNFTGYRKNSNYLAKHDMEWVGRRVRQRPGPQNALGQVNSFSQLSYYFYA
jgi:murein L,D-transpeptidase YcbB/YkuD